ncbi:hypothetical protein H072_6828 [Dactylellina haptotyla CBS 200.50]|uniref:Uncharacterized protein n=1 Tax=Dactylellina haptotyla (strain CBS 200.50) TaxID=1284197 RepID=S8BVU8_DACHA|nr:hypothetical protein H072_6828 [Dactylellina haptotyla CBS 200.50]
MPIAPITGRLKKGLIMDLTIALGGGTVRYVVAFTLNPIRYDIQLYTTPAELPRGDSDINERERMNIGYHVPAVQRRDAFYVRLEQERAEAKASQ